MVLTEDASNDLIGHHACLLAMSTTDATECSCRPNTFRSIGIFVGGSQIDHQEISHHGAISKRIRSMVCHEVLYQYFYTDTFGAGYSR
jgi:hypothetical protein